VLSARSVTGPNLATRPWSHIFPPRGPLLSEPVGASGGPGAEALAARDRRRDAEGTAQDKAGRRDVEADDDDELLEAQGGCAAAPRMSMLILFSVGARELASERLSRGSGRERAMRAGGKGLDLLESVEKRGPKKKENKKTCLAYSLFSHSLFFPLSSRAKAKSTESRVMSSSRLLVALFRSERNHLSSSSGGGAASSSSLRNRLSWLACDRSPPSTSFSSSASLPPAERGPTAFIYEILKRYEVPQTTAQLWESAQVRE